MSRRRGALGSLFKTTAAVYVREYVSSDFKKRWIEHVYPDGTFCLNGERTVATRRIWKPVTPRTAEAIGKAAQYRAKCYLADDEGTKAALEYNMAIRRAARFTVAETKLEKWRRKVTHKNMSTTLTEETVALLEHVVEQLEALKIGYGE